MRGSLTIGIYSINNLINGKRYIGKSKKIENRIWAHFNLLKKDEPSRAVNRHLFAAAKKYGLENFSWEILESFEELNENLLADREVFWMEFYNTTEREFGYNLVKDSSSRTIVHPETIAIFKETMLGDGNPNFGNFWSDEQKASMSQIAIQRHADGFYGDEWKAKISEASKEMWKDDERKARMAKNVSIATSKYRFYQYDKKTMELVRVWESMNEILTEHPDYHNIAIYSVANGHKKSYRGFVWRAEDKSDEVKNPSENV